MQDVPDSLRTSPEGGIRKASFNFWETVVLGAVFWYPHLGGILRPRGECQRLWAWA